MSFVVLTVMIQLHFMVLQCQSSCEAISGLCRKGNIIIGGLVEMARVENYFIELYSHKLEWRRASYLKRDGPFHHSGQMILHCILQNCEYKFWR